MSPVTRLATAAALGCSLSALLAAAPSDLAAAPAWPTRPITLVVSYPPGGDTDVSARLYAEKLAGLLGQPVIVDNKPGAGGVIGNAFVAKARPDGHTLLYANSTLPIVQYVLKVGPSVAYDPVKDFTPIVRDQNIPLVLVTSPASGVQSVRELVSEARGGKDYNYGSPSVGTPMHIAAEIFNREAGIKLPHIAYKGSAPLIADLLGNQISLGWTTPGVILPYAKAGKLVPLALAEPRRSGLLPEVPTLTELGFPGAQMSAWQGLIGPAGLPDEIVQTLNRHMNAIIQMPDVRERLAAIGIEPVGGTPEAFAAQIADDQKRYGALIREFGIKAE